MTQQIETQINIPELIELQLQDIANKSANEECAFLLGSEDNGIVNIHDSVVLTNMDMSPVSFSMDGKEIVSAFRKAYLQESEVVALWHSHPEGLSYPSAKDFHFMNSFPMVWTIYAKKTNKSQSFVRIDEEIKLIKCNIL